MRRDTIYEVTADGALRYYFHAGQMQAWESTRRFVVMLSGTQGGKTIMGPPWLHREIQRCGPGDYMVVTPTFPLLDKKALPEFRRLFEDRLALGRYIGSPSRRFEVDAAGQRSLWGDYGDAYQTIVWFGYAADPDSLEAATAKGVWCDESGQPKFKAGSWEAIRRRLSIHSGRALHTTTPYYNGWLRREFWDKRGTRPDATVVNFRSIDNPSFPPAEYYERQASMPPWRFDMFYNGRFTRPAGLIYDCFDRDTMVVEPFEIPPHWRRYAGLDFGGVNMSAVFLAERPDDGMCFQYREYLDGGRTAAGHAAAMQANEPRLTAYGGAKSEGQWRQEFTAAGLHVMEPKVPDVEVGIDRVYKLMATDRYRVFETCEGTIEQIESYSRPVDEDGTVLEGIENKHDFHYMDGLRYVAPALIGSEARSLPAQPRKKSTWKVG